MNQLHLISGSDFYPCIHLPDEIRIPPPERESFVEIGEGTRPIVARVWMTIAQFLALPDVAKAGTGAIGIRMIGTANVYPAGSTQSLTTTTLTYAKAFYLVKATPVRLAVDADAIMEVLLASEARGWRLCSVNRVYNVLNGDKTAYVSGATSTSSAKTMGAVLTDIAGDVGATIGSLPFTPVAKPQNLFLEYIPADEAIRRLLRPLSLVVIPDPFSSSSDITYTVVQLDYSDTTQADDIDALMAVVPLDGSTSALYDMIGASMAPASLKILFPKWPPASIEWTATSLTSWSKYTESTSGSPFTAGGGTGADAIFVGDHFDVSGKAYTETLSDIADERAEAYWGRAGIPHATQIMVGGYPLLPGVTTRKVRVSMDIDGWFTTAISHSYIDNGPRADALFTGLGSDNNLSARFPEHAAGSSGMFPRDDGAIDWLPPLLTPSQYGVFEVAVIKTTGSAGTSGTACSFGYTIKTFDGSKTLEAAGQQPVEARDSVGSRTEGHYGQALYKPDGTIRLLRVDEVHNVNVCTGTG